MCITEGVVKIGVNQVKRMFPPLLVLYIQPIHSFLDVVPIENKYISTKKMGIIQSSTCIQRRMRFASKARRGCHYISRDPTLKIRSKNSNAEHLHEHLAAFGSCNHSNETDPLSGASFTLVEAFDSPHGTGLRAVRDIEAWEPIIVLPLGSALGVRSGDPSQLASISDDSWRRFPWGALYAFETFVSSS